MPRHADASPVLATEATQPAASSPVTPSPLAAAALAEAGLKQVPSKEAAAIVRTAHEPVRTEPHTTVTENAPGDQRQPRKMKAIAAIAAVLVICGAGGFFLYQKQADSSSMAASVAASAPAQSAAAVDADKPAAQETPAANSVAAKFSENGEPFVQDEAQKEVQLAPAVAPPPVMTEQKVASEPGKRKKEDTKVAAQPKEKKQAQSAQANRDAGVTVVRHEAAKPVAAMSEVQACKREPNFFAREACIFRVCVNRWGQGECPAYNDNDQDNHN